MSDHTPAIVVVDDDDAVRDSLAELLSAAGFEVRTYACANDFLAAYRPQDTACLLLDIRMPDADGIKLHGRLSAEDDAPPVIIITGHGDVAMAVQAMKSGVFDFVEKPFDADVLVEQVHAAVRWGDMHRQEHRQMAEAVRRIEALSPREREVLKLLLAGHSNKAIARELGLSPRTIEVHRANLMKKTGAESLSQLVQLAIIARCEG